MLHSLNELGELSQQQCHDDITVKFDMAVIVILICYYY